MGSAKTTEIRESTIDTQAIGARVRKLRQNLDLTMEAFATSLQMSKHSYTPAEKGMSSQGKSLTFTMTQLVLLKRFLKTKNIDVTLDFLIEGDNSPARNLRKVEEGSSESEIISSYKAMIDRMDADKKRLEDDVRYLKIQNENCQETNRKLVDKVVSAS